jgi:hypothetical protein
LLDLIEELVKEKLWNRTSNKNTANANNYQHRVTVKAHVQVREMNDFVESVEFSKFKKKKNIKKI